MLMLNRRLQILVDDERFDRLAEESNRTGAPVGELVRRAIDREFPPRDTDREWAGQRLLAMPPPPGPEPDWEDQKREGPRCAIAQVGRHVRRFLYDTSIFVYALGGEHPYREPCREIVRRATTGDLQGEASTDLLQEFAHQRLRRTGDRANAAAATRDVAKLVWLHPLEPDDVQRGIDLLETHSHLDARDAVFAALALNRGIDAILATDRAFEEVDGLERIDPADDQALAALAD